MRSRALLPGQVAAETYRQGQLHPGDFEAQVSQRPIAIHGLEHLGATDRGVTMLRRQIMRGIRAVEAGDDPIGVIRDAGGVIPTYCNNTVVVLPEAGDAATDRAIMRKTGLRLAQDYLKQPPLANGRLPAVPGSPTLVGSALTR
jgi:hypothetical protein